jgi:hypothetical protein
VNVKEENVLDNGAVKQAEKESQALTAKTDDLEAKWARERREDLWLITVACASIHGTREVPELAQFADRVLEEFDKRFRKDQPKAKRSCKQARMGDGHLESATASTSG